VPLRSPDPVVWVPVTDPQFRAAQALFAHVTAEAPRPTEDQVTLMASLLGEIGLAVYRATHGEGAEDIT
jgi:hypothetical protein